MAGSNFAGLQNSLQFVMNQWNAPTSTAARKATLLDYLFARVADDNAVDVLKGLKGHDWAFADTNGPVKDKFRDLTFADLQVELAHLEHGL